MLLVEIAKVLQCIIIRRVRARCPPARKPAPYNCINPHDISKCSLTHCFIVQLVYLSDIEASFGKQSINGEFCTTCISKNVTEQLQAKLNPRTRNTCGNDSIFIKYVLKDCQHVW